MRELGLYKPPGVAESIDWASALVTLGASEIDEALVASTIGTVLKYREDQARVATFGLDQLVASLASG